jgi:hypothetical protein
MYNQWGKSPYIYIALTYALYIWYLQYSTLVPEIAINIMGVSHPGEQPIAPPAKSPRVYQSD